MPKYLERIEKEAVNQLPVKSFTGEIHVVDELKDVKAMVKYLEQFDTIGFDTESRPAFKKGVVNKVALLQLASEDRAYLLRLNKVGLPECVAKIFENQDIKKIGLALHDDVRILRELTDFKPVSFLDLQKYVPAFGIKDLGLQKIAANVLGFKVSKSQRLSNWEKGTLETDQLLYAATDAWVTLAIYLRLREK